MRRAVNYIPAVPLKLRPSAAPSGPNRPYPLTRATKGAYWQQCSGLQLGSDRSCGSMLPVYTNHRLSESDSPDRLRHSFCYSVTEMKSITQLHKSQAQFFDVLTRDFCRSDEYPAALKPAPAGADDRRSPHVCHCKAPTGPWQSVPFLSTPVCAPARNDRLFPFNPPGQRQPAHIRPGLAAVGDQTTAAKKNGRRIRFVSRILKAARWISRYRCRLHPAGPGAGWRPRAFCT